MTSMPHGSELQHGELRITKKPGAALRYMFMPGESGCTTLVLFLNGLALPQAIWVPTITNIRSKCNDANISQPFMLSYDRYGQGLSDHDPSDVMKPEGLQSHDLRDAVRDLHEFLTQFSAQHLPFDPLSQRYGHLMVVCNSIGCPIARLFAATYPRTISGFVFLDSMIANTDFVSIWPDPDAPGFDATVLPEGVTSDLLRLTREKYRLFFHPSVPNRERLDRSNVPQLLPDADSPMFPLVEGKNALLSVVGHDWHVFAAENERSFGIPPPLVNAYINPHWQRYNEGLARLTKGECSKGPVIARGTSHFIQRDDPCFVADEVLQMLQNLR